jgi:membrane complex biogenesis BtpA family protein
MIHLDALPGTPTAKHSIADITARAIAEAEIYWDAGFSALMIENMHDRPYLKGGVGPEIVAAMTAVGRELKRVVPLPLGVQVLAAADREAIAVAHACGATFVRVEGFAFAHVADEGIIQGRAGELLRFRRAIGADSVRVFADIKKKHAAHAITADVDIVEAARAAEFLLADGVVVTGTSTGKVTDAGEVFTVHSALDLPVFVGSGVTPENLGEYAEADGFIVGSSVKRGGIWSEPVEAARARALSKAFKALGATV